MAIYGESEKLILNENTRWSFLHIWEPVSINGERPKYSITLVIKKDSPDMDVIRNAIKSVYKNSAAVLMDESGTVPPLATLRLPIRDGDKDRPDDPSYANCYYINAYSVYAPGIVDQDLNEIKDRNQIYSGCFGRASISFYAFNTGETAGIACSLNNLQKIKDGERYDKSSATTSAFDDFRNFPRVTSATTDFAPADTTDVGGELPF